MLRDSRQPTGSEDTRVVRVILPPRFSLATLRINLHTLLRFHELLYTLTTFRLKLRYKQSVLGWLWALIQPLSLMLIYTFVFSSVTRLHTGGVAYPVFVFSGLLPWIFFANSVSSATTGLVNYSHLLTRVSFPTEIIPLSYVAAAFVDFTIASLVLGCLMFHYGIPLTLTALLALPLVFILVLLGTGVALLFSAIQARFRDMGVAMPLLLQVWMFATPVVYPLNAIPRRFRLICFANPVATLVDSFRGVLLQGTLPDPSLLVYSTVFSIIFFALAYMVFKVLDSNMADVI